jgi:hypothetical protein
MSFLIVFLLVVGIMILIGVAISHGGENYPTWTGIIISAMIGMLPLYLILCFFGVMGEERNQPIDE